MCSGRASAFAAALLTAVVLIGCAREAGVAPEGRDSDAVNTVPERPVSAPPEIATEVRRERAANPVFAALDRLDAALAPAMVGTDDESGWTPDVETRALAVLAFTAGGETHGHGEHRETVRSLAQSLARAQSEDGWIGPRGAAAPISHARATLALCELYGLTGSRVLEEPARRALAAVLAAEPTTDRVYPQSREDWILTATTAMVLRSALLSEVFQPSDERASAASHSLMQSLARVAHDALDQPSAATSPHTVAHALLTLVMCDPDSFGSSRAVAAAADRLSSQWPSESAGSVDVEFLYAGMNALWQFNGPPQDRWHHALHRTRKPTADWLAVRSIVAPETTAEERSSDVRRTALLAMTHAVCFRYQRRHVWPEPRQNEVR